MEISKVINNNLIKTFDANQRECIVMGKGIGFKKKPGDWIDDNAIEKIYKIEDSSTANQFTQLVVDIPIEHLRVANMIIDYANNTLNKTLHENIYVSITDHINFALERLEKGIPLKNKILYEIKHYYPSEFQVGQEALNIVERELGVSFPEDEAGYIAIHLVESIIGSEHSDYVNQSVAMIQAILNIIKYTYSLELNTDSLAYERFLVHLRYFAQRVINHKESESYDEGFITTMKKNFEEEYKCCMKIRTYLNKEFQYDVNDDEMIYLCVHIHRILSAK